MARVVHAGTGMVGSPIPCSRLEVSDDVPTMTICLESASLDSCTRHSVGRDNEDLFQTGECLGRVYTIGALLGSGGTGQVYAAHDCELNREVAIKAAWPALDPECLASEMVTLAALAGRGVPQIHGTGTTAAGTRFFVMELLRGTTLTEYLSKRDGYMDLSVALHIMLGVASALSEIHEVDLAHCDLKPANIMLEPREGVRLIDPGSLPAPDDEGAEKAVLRGSPHYMAPEVILSQVEVGREYLMDMYALGVIGFRLLTGQNPFDGQQLEHLLWQHVHQPAPRVSLLRAGVPPRLDRLVEQMLAKAPELRPSTSAYVVAELRAIHTSLVGGLPQR